MKAKLINDGPQKTYVLVLDKGDEAVRKAPIDADDGNGAEIPAAMDRLT